MITVRWLICMMLVSLFLHLLFAVAFGTIALFTFGWWLKTIIVAVLAYVAANWITGE